MDKLDIKEKQSPFLMSILFLFISFVFILLSVGILKKVGNEISLFMKIIPGIFSSLMILILGPLYLSYIFDIKILPSRHIFSYKNFQKTAKIIGGIFPFLGMILMVVSGFLFLSSIPSLLLVSGEIFLGSFIKYIMYFVFICLIPPLILAYYERKTEKLSRNTGFIVAEYKFKLTKAGKLLILLSISAILFFHLPELKQSLNDFLNVIK
jgi:hypothetical protein